MTVNKYHHYSGVSITLLEDEEGYRIRIVWEDKYHELYQQTFGVFSRDYGFLNFGMCIGLLSGNNIDDVIDIMEKM